MKTSCKDINHEQEKMDENPVNYHPPNVLSDWQINGNNLPNASVGMSRLGNSMVESSVCSTTFMPDSFCPPVWDHPIHGHSLGYCDTSIQNQDGGSSGLGPVRAGMNWAQNALLRGSIFLPAVPGMVPPSLPHFPTDPAFIERAARFSCFSGGNFSEMMNPFSTPDHSNPYSCGVGPIQRPNDVTAGVMEQALLPGEHSVEGTSLKNERKSQSFRQAYDEAQHGVDVSANESDEAEFSGQGAQEELADAVEDSCGMGLGSNKRKRTRQLTQDTEYKEIIGAPLPPIELVKDQAETKLKCDQNPASKGKPGGKHLKQDSQGSDLPKEGYIHIRARRGQATNSHSLAERVRREKISERMKFLQDLVPGCSKVTGKAVMLDEIINYVQSLQRQVEFLSMKLATVNPRLDFNIEALLAKDIVQPGAGMLSSPALPLDMTMPFPLHSSQTGLIQATLPCSETIRRPINLQSVALAQVPGVWDGELHSIVRMGLNTGGPLNSQAFAGSLPTGHLKTEP